MESGSFDLHEPARPEELAYLPLDGAAQEEPFARLVVHDEVEIPLPVNLLAVREPVPFFGKRPEALRQYLEVGGAHGDLAGLGPEQLSPNPDDVAEVEKFFEPIVVRALRKGVAREVNLYYPVAVPDLHEARLAHEAEHHYPARHADLVLGIFPLGD